MAVALDADGAAHLLVRSGSTVKISSSGTTPTISEDNDYFNCLILYVIRRVGIDFNGIVYEKVYFHVATTKLHDIRKITFYNR